MIQPLSSVSFATIISRSLRSCLTSKLPDKFRQDLRKGGAKCHSDLFAPAALRSSHSGVRTYMQYIYIFLYSIHISFFTRIIRASFNRKHETLFNEQATMRGKSMIFQWRPCTSWRRRSLKKLIRSDLDISHLLRSARN